MVLSPTSPTLAITASSELANWLHSQKISLAFTTYQTNRLFFIGSNNGRIAAHERLFDKPMGLYAQGDRLYMSTRYQIWRFDNLLAPGETYGECDRLYVPRTAHVTGDLNVHDLVLAAPPSDLPSPNSLSCTIILVRPSIAIAGHTSIFQSMIAVFAPLALQIWVENLQVPHHWGGAGAELFRHIERRGFRRQPHSLLN